jgi:hypothetical protein
VTPIRLRLSNGVDAAVEFTAAGPEALRAGCADALARYCAVERATWDGVICRDYAGENMTLQLHVHCRPAQPDIADWSDPLRPTQASPESSALLQAATVSGGDANHQYGGHGGAYVRALVSGALLERRPPDDWSEIWEWCEQAVRWARALRGFGRRVALDVLPPAELGDADRE